MNNKVRKCELYNRRSFLSKNNLENLSLQFGEPTSSSSNKLLPCAREIRTLQDLQPFFTVLSKGEVAHVSCLTELEDEIELDFLEQLPYSSSSQLK